MRTKQVIIYLALLALLGGLVIATGESPAVAAPAVATNHLVNADFEDGFAASGVATFWESWLLEGSPTFLEITSSTDSRRVHLGSSAQMMTASSTNYRGGLQQTVFGLTPGKRYRFTIWAHAWASSGSDSTKSEGYTNIWLRIAMGNSKTYAADPNLVWSASQHFVDTYQQLSVEMVVADSTVTVFTHANPEVHLLHNDVYWDDASLMEVASTASTSAPSTSPPPTLGIAPTDFPIPTPDANGEMIYFVQTGDSLVHIATITCGETPECLEKLKQLNNISGNTIFIGQRLVIGPFDDGPAPATAEPAAEEQPAESAAEGEPAAEEQPAEEQPAEEQPAEEEQAEQVAEVPAETMPGDGGICVTLYEDKNGNGIRDPDEVLIAGGVFGLFDAATLVEQGSHITDGASEPYCFLDLISGNYRVTSEVPENYTQTTRNDWDLTLAAGSTANLEFGAQQTGEIASEDEEAEGGSRVTTALLGAAGVILLLLAAGVAGFLVLTRRKAAE